MSTLAEVAPLHLRRDVFIPSTFFPWPLSWIGPGVGVGVGVGEPDCAQYLPPVLKASGKSGPPPQTIISLPVQTAVCSNRLVGAFVVLVAVQVFVVGLYLPPLFTEPPPVSPPQTIISLPVQTAVCPHRPVGALVVLVSIQLSVFGLYLPPLRGRAPLVPPHTIISLPLHTPVGSSRPTGAFVVLVGVHVSVPGLYLPPAFT